MKHTPEPWTAMPKPAASYDDQGWRSLSMCGSNWMVAAPSSTVLKIENGAVVGKQWDHEANAKRIVLCVNYCAGEPDASLELFTAKEQVDLKVKFFNEANTYRDLCGELLAALKNTCALVDKMGPKSRAQADSAITKAEAIMGEKA